MGPEPSCGKPQKVCGSLSLPGRWSLLPAGTLRAQLNMAKIYIAYGSVEGQTAHIAEYIADVVRAHGHQAETADLKHSAGSIPDGQDGVIVAASVHVGKHEGFVADFVRKNR